MFHILIQIANSNSPFSGDSTWFVNKTFQPVARVLLAIYWRSISKYNCFIFNIHQTKIFSILYF